MAAATPAHASLLSYSYVSVGYSGSPTLIETTISTLGGIIDAQDSALQVLVVKTLDPLSLIHTVTGLLGVRYAELDENVSPGDSASATRWSSTSTDATRWSSADSTATRWSSFDATATRWSGAGWDATRWSGTSLDGSSTGLTGADPGVQYQWGLGAINAPGAWTTTIGTRDRTICIIDSGVDYAHPDLAANMWTNAAGSHGWDFVNRDSNPMDDAGHGTHVAGIAAGVIGNGVGIAGVAQEKIMAIKVLDSTGSGKESDAAFGLRYCADNGGNVASLSLGTTKDKHVLRDGVSYAQAHGVLVVAAAGNDGCACVEYPAGYAGVLAVGSYDRNGAHSAFSNTGSFVALSAPGENITSTWPGGAYRIGSGTSMATPFVSGAAALAWGTKTTLTATQVHDIMTSTAWSLGPSGWDAQFGYGGVDAHHAVTVAKG